MNCMKCGRETRGENVFCQDCLRVMSSYPVRPGTVVLLPRRKEAVVVKKAPKRHVAAPEERIRFLQKCLLIISVLLVICVTAIVLMFKPTMHYVLDEHVEIGQNYSSVTQTNGTPAPTN